MLNEKSRKDLVVRLNRIRGQVDGIGKMVEEGRYCVDILNQIAAVRAAFSGVGRFILEDHMRTCVVSSIKRGGGKHEIKELMDVFQKF